uniref:Transcription regulator n=1 Tax=Kwoniella dejecticola CBS 10117 TaxID=1296121 RepID=A0A1A6A549_9TREE|nr:uncharacterized protein I303_04522 [Kwoniella dejecticola CBS 10117]OBR85190.1 hypothetical protein I303_04522 [Kwoniella dejecticola CBS 10117]
MATTASTSTSTMANLTATATAISRHQTFLDDIISRQSKRRKLIDPSYTFPNLPILSSSPFSSPTPGNDALDQSTALNVGSPSKAKEKEKENVVNYVKEEETIRNDYSAWFGRSGSGRLPSIYILGAKDQEICEEYPALKKLMNLKSELVENHTHSPLHLHLSPLSSPSDIISSLGLNNKFDVILIHPISSWEETSNLPIRQISADPGFVFLWVGKGDEEGLERGRECFAKWGFRRAEDIVWVKTNTANVSGKRGPMIENGSLFASQKEHCLMGIRGTVRRSTDMRFVHCNVDTDVMVWESDDQGQSSPAFPPYLYTLIENFCLGTRRLELFPTSPNPRKGWVTASSETSNPSDTQYQAFDPATYPSLISESDGRPVLPYHTEIDSLRPKSPQRRPRNLPGGNPSGGSGGRPNSTPIPAFRPQNRQPYNQRPQQQRQMQPQMQPGDMAMQGYNSFPGQGGQTQMNPNQMMMNQMAMMNMGMGLPMGMGMGMGMGAPMPVPMGMGMGMGMGQGMGMMPFNQPQFAQSQGFGNVGNGMGINGGQPGSFQPQMGMPGMASNMPYGFDPTQGNMGMASMGSFNPQQGQWQGQSANQGQPGDMGMGWQGNWQ